MMAPAHRDLDETSGPMPVLTSADGVTWTSTGLIPLDELADRTGFLRVGRILRFGEGLYVSAVHFDSGATASLAWTSSDGRQWRSVPTELPVGEHGSAEVIASTGSRLVASVGERDGSHVWTSADGRIWIEADVPAQGRPVGVYAAYGDEEGFVLVGHLLLESWMPAIWASPDGTSWTAATSLAEQPGGVRGIARGPGGAYVAAVDLDDAATQLVTSDDGVAWTLMIETGHSPEYSRDLDGSDAGVIYLGGTWGGALRALVWTGGGTWEELQPPPGSAEYLFYDLSVGDGTWVAVGRPRDSEEPGSDRPVPVLLTGELPG